MTEKHVWVNGELITSDRMNDLEDRVREVSADLEDRNISFKGDISFEKQITKNYEDNISNKIEHKAVSLTLTNYSTINDDTITGMARMGAEVSLVVMVPTQSVTDSNPTPMDDDVILDFLSRLKAKGVTTFMLKPHLGVVDSFDRGHYVPDDYTSFFNIWKNYMLRVAKICSDNDIPYLSIGCEQFDNTKSTHLQQWLDLIHTVKTAYPDVLLTYAFSATEFNSDDNLGICDYLDVIGFNVYPSLTQKPYSASMNKFDVIGGWWSNPTDGYSFGDRLDKIQDKYKKPTMITESGTRPYLLAINQPHISGDFDENFDAQALYIEAMYYIISRMPYNVGVAWWHGGYSTTHNNPFSFWKPDVVTKSEQTMIKMIGEY